MTTPPTGQQTSYSIFRQLYPALPQVQTGTRSLGRTPADRRRFLAVPNLDDTRMYLPSEPSLAAGALRRARRSIDLRGRVVTSVAASGLRLGLSRVVRTHVDAPITDDCVETQLAELLQQEIHVAVFLGPPRSNRKPVLQVLSADGELLAVAKVGVNALTSDLAHQEAAALREVEQRGFATVVAPRLLGELHRHGHTMVVQSPLSVPGGPAVTDPALLRRMFDEISGSGGVSEASLAESPYIALLRERVLQLPHEEIRAMGSAALTELCAENPQLEFGAWHGDLSPWNMAADGDRVLVWDWERFRDGVPVGYDALHYVFLPLLKNAGAPQEEAGIELLDRADGLLEGGGVHNSGTSTVAMLYLVEVASRFMMDDQVSSGILGGDVQRWLVPALRRFLARERT